MHAADDTPRKPPQQEPDCLFMCQGGVTSQCSSSVKEEWNKTSRGSHNRDTIRCQRCKQCHRCMIRTRTHPEEAIPENRQ